LKIIFILSAYEFHFLPQAASKELKIYFFILYLYFQGGRRDCKSAAFLSPARRASYCARMPFSRRAASTPDFPRKKTRPVFTERAF
jgi:hypothetical protein